MDNNTTIWNKENLCRAHGTTANSAGDCNVCVLDLGNNETVSRGVFPEADGTFTALTFTRSKNFKTHKGAEKWLARNGGK